MLSNLMDKLCWKIVSWRLSVLYKNKLGGLQPFGDTVRWNLAVAGVKIGFSAPHPKDDEEMGKILCDIGTLMQGKRVPVKNLEENYNEL
jgi:hypothetical protein